MTAISKLKTLSRNLWWSWHPEAIDVFRQLNPDAFEASGNNPIVALRRAHESVLERPEFVAEVDRVFQAFQNYMTTPGSHHDAPRTSYFCMEYGLHESIPTYSGGLGILAGDHTKAASDLGVPFTAVGLFLTSGYFRQYFDAKGRQQADYPAINSAKHPFELVKNESGDARVVTVHFGDLAIHIRAWRLMVGKTTLYLLDTDFGANAFDLRFLTRRLYQGDRKTRIQQEIILGIGGLRFLREMQTVTDVYHMNEGHCAFLTFELLREHLASGLTLVEAEHRVKSQCVFTTHTPVIAGHDRFEPELFTSSMKRFSEEIGLSDDVLQGYGRVDRSDVQESFTMTILGLRLSRKANGVSKLNGEVARRQWNHMFADLAPDEVPISHITNGIHLPTWASAGARSFLGKHLGDWENERASQNTWDRIDDVNSADLWAYRSGLREDLISFVRKTISRQSLPQIENLDPDALTIGFARRFATYKRAPLIFSQIERVISLFNHQGKKVQIIFAGKAHPQDEGGKAFIREIFEISQHPSFEGKVILLENYNMEIGRMLVSGCDVWLNNPRRPHEASGTSGQKVAIHGGLNLSILDGWWPEGYDGSNGWSIGSDASHEYLDPEIQDPQDADLLYGELESSVIPLFYDRDESGIPEGWVNMMRSSFKTLTYPFSAHRMLNDYVEQVYTEPIAESA